MLDLFNCYTPTDTCYLGWSVSWLGDVGRQRFWCDPQGSTSRDAWPWTCLRAGQSRVTIIRVLPALCGMKNSTQVRVLPPGIRLKPASSELEECGGWFVIKDIKLSNKKRQKHSTKRLHRSKLWHISQQLWGTLSQTEVVQWCLVFSLQYQIQWEAAHLGKSF